MSPLALLMLVVAKRRQMAKVEKVTTAKLHAWVLSCNWNLDSELYKASLNFLDTRSNACKQSQKQ